MKLFDLFLKKNIACLLLLFTLVSNSNATETLKTGNMLYSSLDASPKDIKTSLSLWMDEVGSQIGLNVDSSFYTSIESLKRDRKLVVFIMLDVDNFKLYNDTYGHQNGDTALIQIAKALKGFANRGGDYAFRLGGEEFGVILTSDDKEKTKVHVMNLLATIEDLKIVHEKNTTSKYITASLGVVFKEPNSILSVSELYKIADDALYEAKNNGRNKVVFID